MSTTTPPTASRVTPTARQLLNKVPEVTIWFWVIKILCTTVGESFADWVSVDLGVGLINTSLIFTVVLATVVAWQLRLPRYQAFSYWLTVVTLSITGTLYTDILTDRYHVPLALSTSVFAVLLAIVFGVWWSKEHTLSIHHIDTLPREAFYWLAILVTFALGTAAGDWTLELTGWTPGVSVLLPVALIAAVVVGWRLGANPVLSFWIAYILTRPLGANLGDWLALTKADGGMNLGTAATSAVFLTAILATVTYLAIRRPDVAEKHLDDMPAVAKDPRRERLMLGYFAGVAVVAITVLAVAHAQPHRIVSAEEDTGGASDAPVVSLTPAQATANFPAADVDGLRTIAQDVLTAVTAGDAATARQRATDLESAWDDAEPRLHDLDPTAWTFLDREIDRVLTAVRADGPDVEEERAALTTLITSLTS